MNLGSSNRHRVPDGRGLKGAPPWKGHVATRTLTFGAYLTTQWLPGKANTLAESTWYSYRRKIERHILPTLGKVPIRRLKVTHLEALYDSKLRPSDAETKALAPKTVLELHLIIRGSLDHAEKRGIVNRNVALVAHAPRLRSIPKHEAQAWTAHTHATLLIKEGVPVKVVSEPLGHATTAFTIETYQPVLPGMQADAANLFGQLIGSSTGDNR